MIIRIPHDHPDCAEKIIDFWHDHGIGSTLLTGKPSVGKTTVLRALAKYLDGEKSGNVLVLDERGELFDIKGAMTDIIRYSSRSCVIENVIRALNPRFVIMDEVDNERDADVVRFLHRCGIVCLASTHFIREEAYREWNFETVVHLPKRGEMIICDQMHH